MKTYIAADHGGYELKKEIANYLQEKGYVIEDMGNKEHDPQDDYPDFVFPLAEKVAKEMGATGIILGRSGNGEAIAANKVKGIRAAVCLNVKMAKKAREDNDANILSLGADYVDLDTAKKIIDTFLETFSSKEEKHKRRVSKITSYESA
ncbi:ribose-5-phosphate isomerase [Candidatus Woesebacteria bacterium]|nr:MAG: ribose-5-phosphate isomerase [Candidatus Woesebacteria bacterium]